MGSSRVLLVTCSLAAKWIPTIDRFNGHYPLGIGYLHACLEQVGHEVHTLFLNQVDHDECQQRILAEIESFQPEVLGVSIISDSRVSSFRVVEQVHARFPGIHIVLGGVHVTTLADQIARHFPYCTLALGEAEQTLCDLVDALRTGRARREVKGLAFFEDGQVVRTEARELIEDLDSLPYPKHEAFFSDQRIVAQVLTSRGCPCRCTFCVLDSFSRGKVRFRSARNVVDEIEYIVKRFPQVGMIQILDDQFFADNQRVIEICDEIVRRKIRCNFQCSGRFRPLSREMIVALERAGVSSVYLGLESGAREVLKKSKKGIVPEDAIKAMEMFSGSNIEVIVLMIVGLPGESVESILETGRLIQRMQKIKYHMYTDRVQTIYVYPGSELYEMCKQAGSIRDEFWLSDADVPYYTVEHSETELRVFREMLMTYISPVRLTTPGGLAAQRHLLPEIIRFCFNRRDLQPLAALVRHATQELVEEGSLSFTMHPNWAARMQADGCIHVTQLSRELGSSTQYQVDFYQVSLHDAVDRLVEFAFQTGYREVMDKVVARVDKLLTDHVEHAPGEDGLLARLGFTQQWLADWSNSVVLRL